MSILEVNGAAIVAMAGDGCIGIASDTRLGMQAQTVACDFQKVFHMNDKTMVGLAGLATDVQTVRQNLEFRTNMYSLTEERDIEPSTFAHMMSSMLYARRFGPYFVEPVVAGLDGPNNKPYLCALDLLGAPVYTDDFVVAGTCGDNLYGVCETFYKPGLGPDDLFETLSQCLLAAVDRDAISGWGGVVHIMTPTEITTRKLRARQD